MSDTIISVEKLSKRYRLGQIGATSLREEAERVFTRLRMRNGGEVARLSSCPVGGNNLVNQQPTTNNPTTDPQELWALRDVSFEVKRGEVLGIIGRNGAGKSTLLKILSRITEPTSGRAVLRGRVGSLLEVGTGFHPELSGRENIFLNGAILGMRKREIAAKFDEIVAFAEVEKFIDTPVKRYSSGMYVRLAFAVAAHLDPEILLVDEVLAVGDAAFQKKCLGKMGEVAHQGRTVLFVSHNMAAVSALVENVLILQYGTTTGKDPVARGVQAYLADQHRNTKTDISLRDDRKGNQSVKFTGVEFIDADSGNPVAYVRSGSSVVVRLFYESIAEQNNVQVAITVHSPLHDNLFQLDTRISSGDFAGIPEKGVFSCVIRNMPLLQGCYPVNIFCRVGEEIADWILDAFTLEIDENDFYGSGRLPSPNQGVFLVAQSWSVTATRNSMQKEHQGDKSVI